MNEGKRLTGLDHIGNREFGFFYWDKMGMMQRHLSFLSVVELQNFLIERAPQHAYVSAAYYHSPSASSMDEKDSYACNFIIDIDADHLPLTCQKDHDTYKCKECGSKGKGAPPARCKCGSTRFDSKNWICDNCLDVAKSETQRVIEDFLIPDFGLSKSDMLVKFSGNRGYHIEVMAEDYKYLEQRERQEIVDYLLGIDLNLDQALFIKKDLTKYGWQRRMHAAFLDLFQNISMEKLGKFNIQKPVKNKLINYSTTFLQGLSKNPSKLKSVSGISQKTWSILSNKLVSEINAKIDAPVSFDIKRLLRLPSSLHGKTGLIAIPVSLDFLDRFDPLKDAIAFKRGEIYLVMRKCPEFRMMDCIYGPYEGGEKVNLPMAAAVFALSKRIAELPKRKQLK
ncbi:MAG: DNA primase small subunit domain-containing protein [Candidatus Helarchaeota archaeon]